MSDFNDLSAELTLANSQSIACAAEQQELAQLRRERDALLALLDWASHGRRVVFRIGKTLHAECDGRSADSPVELCAELGIPGFEEEK